MLKSRVGCFRRGRACIGCLELFLKDTACHGQVQHGGDSRGQTVSVLLQQSGWYRIQDAGLSRGPPDKFLNFFVSVSIGCLASTPARPWALTTSLVGSGKTVLSC